jgi:hypothetical protein
MKCGLCHNDVPMLSQSHIIPKSVMMLGREENSSDPMVIVPSNAGQRVIRSQAAIWSEIVCRDCEASFQAGDDELLALCRTVHEGQIVGPMEHPVACKVYPTIDSARLHRGLLATLYRAHLSPHPFFKQVNLGPVHGEAIRNLLLSREPLHRGDYRMVLTTVPNVSAGVVLSPYRVDVHGVNGYKLFFPHLTALVKVDRQAFPQPLQKGALGMYDHAHAIHDDQIHANDMQRIVNATIGREEDIERFARRR